MRRNSKSNADERPNILFIFTDQQRADAIGVVGDGNYNTPNLDRLCGQSTAFLSAYTPSPVCVPARCSMMYGQYPHNTGCYENSFPMPTDGRDSFVDSLSKAGYRTHGVGKCHFTPDLFALRGFQSRDIQEHPPKMEGSTSKDDYVRELIELGFGSSFEGAFGDVHENKYVVPAQSTVPDDLHPSKWVVDKSIDFIDEASAGKKPWFLFSSFFHPHPPLPLPSDWLTKVDPGSVPPPSVPYAFEELQTERLRRQNQGWYIEDDREVQRLRGYYYAMVSYVDHEIGRLLDYLESRGFMRNTAVIFSADHGEYLGDYRCFGKRSMHDASARVPLLIRWPERFAPGGRCSRPVNLVDMAPTVLSLADIDGDYSRFDGEDLANTVSDRSDRKYVFSQHDSDDEATFMVADERWKYFMSVADDREYLFDRQNDPREMCNVAEKHEQTLAELRRALKIFNPEFEEAQLSSNIGM